MQQTEESHNQSCSVQCRACFHSPAWQQAAHGWRAAGRIICQSAAAPFQYDPTDKGPTRPAPTKVSVHTKPNSAAAQKLRRSQKGAVLVVPGACRGHEVVGSGRVKGCRSCAAYACCWQLCTLRHASNMSTTGCDHGSISESKRRQLGSSRGSSSSDSSIGAIIL